MLYGMCRIPVKQGNDGLHEFTARIRELFRLPEDVDISLTFGCKVGGWADWGWMQEGRRKLRLLLSHVRQLLTCMCVYVGIEWGFLVCSVCLIRVLHRMVCQPQSWPDHVNFSVQTALRLACPSLPPSLCRSL
jgi:hypothetical protein